MPKAKSSARNETTRATAPSIGEVMASLMVLDMITASATVRLLRFHDSKEKAELTAQILDEIDTTCRRKGLFVRDIMDAQDYARKLLYNAQAQADRLDDIKHGYINQEQS